MKPAAIMMAPTSMFKCLSMADWICQWGDIFLIFSVCFYSNVKDWVLSQISQLDAFDTNFRDFMMYDNTKYRPLLWLFDNLSAWTLSFVKREPLYILSNTNHTHVWRQTTRGVWGDPGLSNVDKRSDNNYQSCSLILISNFVVKESWNIKLRHVIDSVLFS